MSASMHPFTWVVVCALSGALAGCPPTGRDALTCVTNEDCPGGLACTEGRCEEAPDATEGEVAPDVAPDVTEGDAPAPDEPDAGLAEGAVSCGGYAVAPSEGGRAFELTIDKLSTGIVRLPEGFTLVDGDSAAEGPCCAGGCCQ
jgi:hypothetical protein